jgi:hypothetical protein
MESEGLLQCSQEPPTGLRPEPVQSIPHSHNSVCRNQFSITLHLRVHHTKYVFSLGFRLKFCTHLQFLHACYISIPSHPPSFSHFIWRCVQIMKMIKHSALHPSVTYSFSGSDVLLSTSFSVALGYGLQAGLSRV